MVKKSSQYMVGFNRYVALAHKGAIPGIHAYPILQHRVYIKQLVDEGQKLPIMFSRKSHLRSWARDHGCTIEEVDGINSHDALIIRGPEPPAQQHSAYQSIELIWVRAKYPYYRKALRVWLRKSLKGDPITRFHKAAARYHIQAAKDLKVLATNPNAQGITPKLAMDWRNDHLNIQKPHLRQIAKRKIDWKLVDRSFGPLDADHVLNKASVKNNPNAWVLLLPVPADANRGFGREIEAFLPEVRSTTTRVDLTYLTAFKVFASIMPRSAAELTTVISWICGQLPKPYVEAMKIEVAKRMRQPNRGIIVRTKRRIV